MVPGPCSVRAAPLTEPPPVKGAGAAAGVGAAVSGRGPARRAAGRRCDPRALGDAAVFLGLRSHRHGRRAGAASHAGAVPAYRHVRHCGLAHTGAASDRSACGAFGYGIASVSRGHPTAFRGAWGATADMADMAERHLRGGRDLRRSAGVYGAGEGTYGGQGTSRSTPGTYRRARHLPRRRAPTARASVSAYRSETPLAAIASPKRRSGRAPTRPTARETATPMRRPRTSGRCRGLMGRDRGCADRLRLRRPAPSRPSTATASAPPTSGCPCRALAHASLVRREPDRGLTVCQAIA